MEHSFINYKQSNRQVLQSADGFLYSKASKSNTVEYVRCVLRDCPGTGRVKREQNEFGPQRPHNHGPAKYQIQQNQLAVNLRQKAACPSHTKDTLKDIFKESTRVMTMAQRSALGILNQGCSKLDAKYTLVPRAASQN
jgi:hypothetical protein